MISAEDNLLLTSVGKGTPGGDFHRRYWHPVATVSDLAKNPVKKVRILGENLILHRSLRGTLGLTEEKCPHRNVSLEYGIPDNEGIRCPYHGWLFNSSGLCLNTPLEPAASKVALKACIKAYPVQELSGLIFAYLGVQPAPKLPKWDLFVSANSLRQIGTATVNCNWLQIAENGQDVRHSEYTHGHFYEYVLKRNGKWPENPEGIRPYRDIHHPITKNETKKAANGFINIIERSATPSQEFYRGIHNYHIFPYAVRHGGLKPMTSKYDLHWRVPIDDTTSWYIYYEVFTFPPDIAVPKQEMVPHFEIPLWTETGDRILDDSQTGQDIACWESQGAIADRTIEKLGSSDMAIVAFRDLLRRQIEIVKNGGIPMNVFENDHGSLELEPPIGMFDKDYKTVLLEHLKRIPFVISKYGSLHEDIKNILGM